MKLTQLTGVAGRKTHNSCLPAHKAKVFPMTGEIEELKVARPTFMSRSELRELLPSPVTYHSEECSERGENLNISVVGGLGNHVEAPALAVGQPQHFVAGDCFQIAPAFHPCLQHSGLS